MNGYTYFRDAPGYAAARDEAARILSVAPWWLDAVVGSLAVPYVPRMSVKGMLTGARLGIRRGCGTRELLTGAQRRRVERVTRRLRRADARAALRPRAE